MDGLQALPFSVSHQQLASIFVLDRHLHSILLYRRFIVIFCNAGAASPSCIICGQIPLSLLPTTCCLAAIEWGKGQLCT